MDWETLKMKCSEFPIDNEILHLFDLDPDDILTMREREFDHIREQTRSMIEEWEASGRDLCDWKITFDCSETGKSNMERAELTCRSTSLAERILIFTRHRLGMVLDETPPLRYLDSVSLLILNVKHPKKWDPDMVAAALTFFANRENTLSAKVEPREWLADFFPGADHGHIDNENIDDAFAETSFDDNSDSMPVSSDREPEKDDDKESDKGGYEDKDPVTENNDLTDALFAPGDENEFGFLYGDKDEEEFDPDYENDEELDDDDEDDPWGL